MSYLQAPPADEKTAAIFEAVRSAFGFVPHFYQAQTARADFVELETRLTDAIIIQNGALTRQAREYLFLVCSASNLSTYCVTAHCEIVRLIGLEGPEPEQVAVDHMSTALPVRMKVLLNFAKKLTEHPTKVGSHDIDALRTYGYTDQQIMEAVVIVGWAKFANFVGFGLGLVPDFDSSKILFQPGASEALSSIL